MLPNEQTIKTATAMHEYAAQLLPTLAGGSMVLLYGELGAGKTTFVQGLAKALGITDRVTSPTFTIAAEYQTQHPTIRRLTHLDLYRLEARQADKEAVVQEALSPADDEVVVIEWADRLQQQPSNAHRLTFKLGAASNERIVTKNLSGSETQSAKPTDAKT